MATTKNANASGQKPGAVVERSNTERGTHEPLLPHGLKTKGSSRLVSRCKTVSRIAAIAVILIAGIVLFGGWLLGNPGLQSLAPGLPKMTPNTALGLFLLAVSLFLQNSLPQQRRTGWIARSFAALVTVLGVLTAAEYLFRANLGIDGLLFKDLTAGATYPGRPSPHTALALTLTGASLLFLGGRRWVLTSGQALGIAAGFVALVAVVGYVHGSSIFYGVTTYTGMAVHTALSFLLLSLGILLVQPDQGLMTVITNDSAAGVLTRRLVPAIVAIPLLLGALRAWGERKGLYTTEFGLALHATLYVAILALLLGFFARGLERQEARRRQAERALRESEAHLWAILQSVPILTLVVDADRRVLELNDTAVDFTGKPVTEIVGLRGGEALGCLHSLDDPRGCGFGTACQICQVRLAVLDTLETGKNHYKVEWHLPFTRNGKVEEMTFLFSTTWLPTPEREVLLCIDDITDLKEAEMEVRQLNKVLEQHAAELEAANKELETFSYSVSHDLRAPLRSMTGFSQVLVEDYGSQLDETAKQYLKRIQESGELMSQLIDDMLQLSRLTQAEMHVTHVDISALAQSIVAELRRNEPERLVDIKIEEGISCQGDNRLLRQALENLIENAWKFTGKVLPPRIEVGVTNHNGELAYFVRDNGAGFDMTYADKLFKPFQRLHEAEEFSGTGIGLATVQRVIHRHGGRVWAEGAVGNGATFYFTLNSL